MVLLPSIHKQYLKATKPIKLVKRGQNWFVSLWDIKIC
jgi:hypothetical protein